MSELTTPPELARGEKHPLYAALPNQSHCDEMASNTNNMRHAQEEETRCELGDNMRFSQEEETRRDLGDDMIQGL